jgi:hypothetical protein
MRSSLLRDSTDDFLFRRPASSSLWHGSDVKPAEKLADARTASEHGAQARALDLAWRAAASAARVNDEEVLAGVVDLTDALPDAEQLRVYAEAALEDARNGTRPPSTAERLFGIFKRRADT